MSEHGGTTGTAVPLSPPVPPEATPRRRRRWPLVVVALVVLGAAVGGAAWQLREPRYPDRWDPRVAPYVEVVESERGLDFDHPVEVEFMSPSQFREEVTTSDSELTDEDREAIDESAALLKSFGLVEPDLDLEDAWNELMGSGIVGLYDPEDERIYMRGTELTPSARSTLVHELTHALQDQRFGIGDRMEELGESEDSAAASGYHTLVEGDASRIESAWREDLGAADEKALTESETEEQERIDDETADLPVVLQTLLSSPYALGEAMLALAEEEGDGNEAVDDLFRRPPATEEHLLDPWTLVPDREESRDVDPPALRSGEEEVDRDTLGASSLMLVLAERIAPRQALRAADGWGGDAFVTFERDGTTCTRLAYEADFASDLAEMEQAMRAWIAQVPSGTARVDTRDGGLLMESCDPGEAYEKPTGGSEEALTLAAYRTWISIQLRQSDFGRAGARCGSDALVREFSVEELNSPQSFPRRTDRALGSCPG